MVRTQHVPRLEAGTTSWSDACTALTAARNAEAVARTSLETAQDDWAALMEKVYGALLGEVGRAKAERFFPRSRRTTDAGSDTPSE